MSKRMGFRNARFCQYICRAEVTLFAEVKLRHEGEGVEVTTSATFFVEVITSARHI